MYVHMHMHLCIYSYVSDSHDSRKEPTEGACGVTGATGGQTGPLGMEHLPADPICADHPSEM